MKGEREYALRLPKGLKPGDPGADHVLQGFLDTALAEDLLVATAVKVSRHDDGLLLVTMRPLEVEEALRATERCDGKPSWLRRCLLRYKVIRRVRRNPEHENTQA